MSTINPASASIYEQVGLTRNDDVKTNDELGQSDFLKLMTTQLQNQDPFSPMENTEFLSQMAQFGTVSGVEKLNGSFDSLASALNGNRALQASMIVGSQVLVASPSHALGSSGGLEGAVDLPVAVGDLRVRVEDAFGQTLASLPLGQHNGGLVDFAWDGTTSNGARAPAGRYTLIAEATAAGQQQRFETLAMANVDSVTLGRGTGDFTLSLSGIGDVGMDQVRQIKQ